jgi:hypothetical protein
MQAFPEYIVLPPFSHKYETWSLTPREEHRLRVDESFGMQRVYYFGCMRTFRGYILPPSSSLKILHGATTQKATSYIQIAVKISNCT